MATFDPDLALLEGQIRSIKAQTCENWFCVVSDDATDAGKLEQIRALLADDPRFRLSASDERRGFYRNFERCLEFVPRDAAYVALADQDDVWHPDKLKLLVEEAAGSEALLIYGDMRVVDREGKVLSPTFWVGRTNNHTDLGSLLLTNTVTGAASLFRRSLLEDVLPFPAPIGEAYHDHWIACVALALGSIAYLDVPVHDYVQHGSNVVGHGEAHDDLRGGLQHAARRFVVSPRRRWHNTVTHARRYYEDDVVRRQVLARALEERLGDRIRPKARADVERVARLGSSLRSLAWLLGRSGRDIRGTSPTLGIENQLVKGVLWHWGRIARARLTP